MDVVFLIDASASVGENNFRGELGFVRKLIRSFNLEPSMTRIAIVSFASRGQIIRHIDHISQPLGFDAKCHLMSRQLDNISYSGGGTYTYGALMEAHVLLKSSRTDAEKVVFLVTDGFSNGGDPRSPARLLKDFGATIFTFGIQTGNIDELRDIASEPSYAYNYLLNSFSELEILARKAVHRDFKIGPYVTADLQSCELVCAKDRIDTKCCDPTASCSCGTGSGRYKCMCPVGYTGSGLTGSCKHRVKKLISLKTSGDEKL
ncbi:hypothetical protein QAD02_012453 [Eretmocerus hayati]|uniref:Uncharacterized protein n=1 Tax=Eretmocerus hayati TaxID=131215 RepID=A0ACC2P0R6_9HYME|nr:hypothetical protein QAD02_012453 [Eretmocerus hayati]